MTINKKPTINIKLFLNEDFKPSNDKPTQASTDHMATATAHTEVVADRTTHVTAHMDAVTVHIDAVIADNLLVINIVNKHPML